MKLRNLERTCIACPSQWEGETDDGREVYVRYRYGRLRLVVGSPAIRDPYWEYPEQILVELEHGDSLDGTMLTGEMLELTGLVYDGDEETVDRDGGADFFYLSPEEQDERLRENLRSLGFLREERDEGTDSGR